MFALDRDGKNITKAQSGSPKVRNSSQPAYFGKETNVIWDRDPKYSRALHINGRRFLYVLYYTYTTFRHPNTSWEGVLGTFGGSRYPLRMCLDTYKLLACVNFCLARCPGVSCPHNQANTLTAMSKAKVLLIILPFSLIGVIISICSIFRDHHWQGAPEFVDFFSPISHPGFLLHSFSTPPDAIYGLVAVVSRLG